VTKKKDIDVKLREALKKPTETSKEFLPKESFVSAMTFDNQLLESTRFLQQLKIPFTQQINSSLFESEWIEKISQQQSSWSDATKSLASLIADKTKGLYPAEFLNNPQLLGSLSKSYDIGISNKYVTQIGNICFTDEIKNLMKAFEKNDVFNGVKQFSDYFRNNELLAPNIALLKLNRSLYEVIRPDLNSSMSQIIDTLQGNTAEIIGKYEQLAFSVADESFFFSSSPEKKVTIDETEALCSGLAILKRITLDEMVEFLYELSDVYGTASSHPVGQKILDCVRGWKDLCGFDRDIYYHGRTKGKEDLPLVPKELGPAPPEFDRHNRYSYPGFQAFYFCDEVEGVKKELLKHYDAEDIYIDKLLPKGKISLVDISAENLDIFPFIKYCRSDIKKEDRSLIKKDYLVPSYFATCCKTAGLDGIKYYGDKDYNNYVTWNDSHFRHVPYI